MDDRNDDGDRKVDEVLLPGFRFHPTDEELVGFYLRKKLQHQPISIELIKQLDIYKYDPWDLPKFASTGEKEWYFYCPRDRKYRNSARPNRVTGAGFWKATGTDRPIYSSEGNNKCIGLKKSLVFYKGRSSKGVKTDWMMHEFRLPSIADSFSSKRSCVDKTLPINDSWAICRIFKKTSPITPRTLSHSWVSSSLPNPNPNPNPTSMQTNSINELADVSMQSLYPFSLSQDLSTFKPIYPNPNDFNPTIFGLPPSYIMPQLEDSSDHKLFKPNTDNSSMLFDNSCEGHSEFSQGHGHFGLGMLPEDQHFNGDYYDQSNLSNLVNFEEDHRERGGTIGLYSMEGLLPLDHVGEAWKTSSTPLLWDCAPLS